MAKEILANAFVMNCVTHQSPGLWRHPDDRSSNYNTLGYWLDLAQTLEQGLFDAMFLADVLGVYDVYGGSMEAAVRGGIQIPVNDPLLLVPAMAAVTKNLGFGVTSTLTYEAPFPFARRMTTLDHLTNGRIAWNIVTGYLNSAAKGLGQAGQPQHDDRYGIAEDYMQVVYKLWEGSWEDGAVLRDRKSGVFADPAKVHKVTHNGPHYQLDAVHLGEPSPQRTPLLFQAGTSTKGRRFAARHAECVFVAGPTRQVLAGRVGALRQLTAETGRDPASTKIFSIMTIITAATEAEARDKHEEYRRYVSEEGALTLVSGWTGVDLSRYDPDEPIQYEVNDSGRSALESLTTADPNRLWTIREIARFAAIGGIGPVVVGSPSQVADEIESWVADTGVDGLNLAFAISPGSFEDFADFIVPELQTRGVYKTSYAPGTLREKMNRRPGARLREDHPAASFRRVLAQPRPAKAHLDG